MKFHILNKIKLFIRKTYLKPIIKKLNNSNFSIITNTCIGGYILHDYKQRFNSPFINTFIPIRSFYLLLLNFEENIKLEPTCNEQLAIKNGCPVGTIIDKDGNDINFYFAHSNSFEEAINDWKRRINRICLKNLLFIVDERDDGLTEEYIKLFNSLPFKVHFFSYRKIKNVKGLIKYKKYAWEYNTLSFRKPFDKLKLYKLV